MQLVIIGAGFAGMYKCANLSATRDERHRPGHVASSDLTLNGLANEFQSIGRDTDVFGFPDRDRPGRGAGPGRVTSMTRNPTYSPACICSLSRWNADYNRFQHPLGDQTR